MKVFLIICFGCTLLTTFPVKAQEQVVPFALTDRDRMAFTGIILEALETKMDIRFEAVNQRFEAVNQRMDYIFWLLRIIVGLLLFILGYMIWDRRAALKAAPLQLQYCESLAANMPDIAEKLKTHGLL